MPEPLTDVEKTILAEAAGEGEEGMYAVASVIFNRAQQRKLDPIAVVNQPYQFSGRWRKDLDEFVSRQPSETLEAMRRAVARAKKDPLPADHFLTTELYASPQRPAWATQMRAVKTIGNHIFLDSNVRRP
jgi:spore germination cell wall hydrolase CwlJ-like protein